MNREEKKEIAEGINKLEAKSNKTKRQKIEEAIQELEKRMKEDQRFTKVREGKYKGGGFEIETL